MRLFGNEIEHFFLGEQIVSIVDRLIADTDFGHIGNRLRAAAHKHIITLDEISIYVAHFALELAREEIFVACRAVTETHYHAVHMSLQARLTVPAESVVGKVYGQPVAHQRLPQVGNLLALSYRVGRYQCSLNGGATHIVGSTLIPCANVVDVTHIVPFRAKSGNHILFLGLLHHSRTDKWRVADDVAEP